MVVSLQKNWDSVLIYFSAAVRDIKKGEFLKANFDFGKLFDTLWHLICLAQSKMEPKQCWTIQEDIFKV